MLRYLYIATYPIIVFSIVTTIYRLTMSISFPPIVNCLLKTIMLIHSTGIIQRDVIEISKFWLIFGKYKPKVQHVIINGFRLYFH